MPQGSKKKYTDKQKRQAEQIEESYEKKGISSKEADARAWATVNKQSGGGERAGGSAQKKTAVAKASSRKSSARRGVATRNGQSRMTQISLGTQTKVELMKLAREKDIPGRSSMNKKELIEALHRAQ